VILIGTTRTARVVQPCYATSKDGCVWYGSRRGGSRTRRRGRAARRERHEAREARVVERHGALRRTEKRTASFCASLKRRRFSEPPFSRRLEGSRPRSAEEPALGQDLLQQALDVALRPRAQCRCGLRASMRSSDSARRSVRRACSRRSASAFGFGLGRPGRARSRGSRGRGRRRLLRGRTGWEDVGRLPPAPEPPRQRHRETRARALRRPRSRNRSSPSSGRPRSRARSRGRRRGRRSGGSWTFPPGGSGRHVGQERGSMP